MALQLAERICGKTMTLHDMPVCEARLVLAMRIATSAEKTGHEAGPYVAQRLGSVRLANSFSLVMVAVAQHWPDNFQLGRPCCSALTFDEVQFASLFRRAAVNDRRAFDRALAEMLPGEARDFIFARMRSFARDYLGRDNRPD